MRKLEDFLPRHTWWILSRVVKSDFLNDTFWLPTCLMGLDWRLGSLRDLAVA